jgi:hypothetical protein
MALLVRVFTMLFARIAALLNIVSVEELARKVRRHG